jgi:tetratricopeptide (TPR) repeat protein
MSPEQAEGRIERLGPRSDVYGLGATLYSILTGKPPFEGSDHLAILTRVSAGDFARPRQVDPAVPVALEAICLKAMALDPEGRYASPRELGEDIERWLADEPVRAYPEPLPVRAMRWIRRRKQWVAAAAVILILTVLGLAIHNRQITREKARTSDQLAMTRDALRDLLQVSGEKLARVPNTEKFREDLARLVLDRYQQLGERFPNDPGIRSQTAHVFRVIGGIERITGRFAKARESYDRAIGLLTALCDEDPGHSEYRLWLADAFAYRGDLHHMDGRTLDAENDLRAAIGHAEKLRSTPIASAGGRVKASALIDLSEILVLKAQPAEARTAADGAVELLRPLAADEMSGSTDDDRWLLSMALTARGVASGETGERDRATLDFDEASRIAGSMAQGREVYDDAQFQLASIANQRGERSSRDSSSSAESEGYYNEASRILERLIKDHGQISHYREEMAATRGGRAAVRLAAGRISEAEQDCAAALDCLNGLIDERASQGAAENPEYLSLLGRVLALQCQIHLQRGRSQQGQKARTEAVDKLSRALAIDPARAVDRERLEQIKRDPAR